MPSSVWQVRVLDQFLRLFSMCAGRAPSSSKAQLLKTAATILRQRLSSPLPHEEAQVRRIHTPVHHIQYSSRPSCSASACVVATAPHLTDQGVWVGLQCRSQ